MGGGGGAGADHAVAEVEQQIGGLELTDLVPFRCGWPGCKEKRPNGATRVWIAQHRKNHRDIAKAERKAEARKEAKAAKIQRAAGPSRQRREARRKQDLAARQRAEQTVKGVGKKKERGRDNGKQAKSNGGTDDNHGGGRRNG